MDINSKRSSIKRGYMACVALTTLAACNKHKQGVTNDDLSDPNFTVKSESCAHMVAQGRVKQLATKDSQDKLLEVAIQCLSNRSEEEMEKLIENMKIWSNQIEHWIAAVEKEHGNQQAAVDELLGYPIARIKTHVQLNRAIAYAEGNLMTLLASLKEKKLCGGLTNDVGDGLPILGLPLETGFYGNGNAPASTALLISIVATFDRARLDELLDDLAGAVAFYLLPTDYKIPIEDNPFCLRNENGAFLLGDFQFGGQRTQLDQSYLGAEDASSAVLKASRATACEVKHTASKTIIDAIKENKKLPVDYTLVTQITGSPTEEHAQLIEPGDICVLGGGMFVIDSKPEDGMIVSYSCSRGIDLSDDPKVFGYGVRIRGISNAYIVRSSRLNPFIPVTMKELLKKIDTNYRLIFPNGPDHRPGECSDFLKDIVQEENVKKDIIDEENIKNREQLNLKD